MARTREVQIGQPIKGMWFRPVAEILAAMYRLRRGVALAAGKNVIFGSAFW